MSEQDDRVIHVSAVVFHDARGAMLTVRKRGTSRFMLPGGKPEPGETPAQTAVRECAEELNVAIAAGDLRELGRFRADAANEPGRLVEATVFTHPPVAVTAPAREIAELRWLERGSDLPSDLAPLLSTRVIPALAAD